MVTKVKLTQHSYWAIVFAEENEGIEHIAQFADALTRLLYCAAINAMELGDADNATDIACGLTLLRNMLITPDQIQEYEELKNGDLKKS